MPEQPKRRREAAPIARPAYLTAKPRDTSRLRKLLATGVRGAGGLFGIGWAPGAAFGAGSEGMAQLIEEEFKPEQLASAAAVGALGGSYAKGLLRGGKALTAMLRGGALSGSIPFVQRGVEGELPSPSEVAASAAIGGGAAGVLHKLLGLGRPTTTTTVKPKPIPGHYQKAKRGEDIARGRFAGRGDIVTKARLPQAGITAEQERLKRAMELELPPDVSEVQLVKGMVAEAKALAKVEEEAEAAQKVKELMEGLVTTGRSARESAGVRIPGGRLSAGISYGRKKEPPVVGEIATPVTDVPQPTAKDFARMLQGVPMTPEAPLFSVKATRAALRRALGAVPPARRGRKAEPSRTRPIRAARLFSRGVDDVLAQAPEVPPQGILEAPRGIPEAVPARPSAPGLDIPVSPLQFLRSKAAADAWQKQPPEVFDELERLWGQYRGAQGAEKRGLGAQLSEIRRFMEGKSRPTAPLSVAPVTRLPPADITPPATPTAKTRMLDELARLLKNQKGAIPPEVMIRLGLGAAGAAVGGVTDPLDNPLLSALSGSAAGFYAPSVARGLAQLPKVAQQMATSEGAKDVVRTAGRYIPQIQRSNLLLSAYGLPANAALGPWSAAFWGGVEMGMAGDPRGYVLAKSMLDLKGLSKQVPEAIEEAKSLIGTIERAEGRPFSEATTEFDRFLAAPGVAMTTGDVIARNQAELAGLPTHTAREMTLTSEPRWDISKKIVRLSKNPFGQTLMPFSRTLMNLVEQGAERTPLIGFLVHAYKRDPDPLKLQLMQQLIGTGMTVGAEQLGEQLTPEDARIIRRYVSNAAGRYSLPASTGFAIGQARRAGARGREMILPATRELTGAIPLPSLQPATDLAQFLAGRGDVPRGAYPAILREVAAIQRPPQTGRGLRRLRQPRRPQG